MPESQFYLIQAIFHDQGIIPTLIEKGIPFTDDQISHLVNWYGMLFNNSSDMLAGTFPLPFSHMSSYGVSVYVFETVDKTIKDERVASNDYKTKAFLFILYHGDLELNMAVIKPQLTKILMEWRKNQISKIQDINQDMLKRIHLIIEDELTKGSRRMFHEEKMSQTSIRNLTHYLSLMKTTLDKEFSIVISPHQITDRQVCQLLYTIAWEYLSGVSLEKNNTLKFTIDTATNKKLLLSIVRQENIILIEKSNAIIMVIDLKLPVSEFLVKIIAKLRDHQQLLLLCYTEETNVQQNQQQLQKVIQPLLVPDKNISFELLTPSTSLVECFVRFFYQIIDVQIRK